MKHYARADTYDGALVRFRHPSYGEASATYLLDFSDNDRSSLGHRYFLFSEGRTWEDPYGPLSLTVESVSPAGLTVRVERADDCLSVSPSLKTYSYFPQEGVFDVYAGEDCAWQARSDSGWIEMDAAAASGVGPAQVRYALRGHAGSGARSGKITVGQQVHAVIQQENQMPPVIEELSRQSGSGAAQVFRVVVSDPNALLRSDEDVPHFSYQGLVLKAGDAVCDASALSAGFIWFRGGDGECFDESRSQVTYAEGKAVFEYHFNLPQPAWRVVRGDAVVHDRSSLTARKRGTWVLDAASEKGPPVVQQSYGWSLSSGAFRGNLDLEDPDGVVDIATVDVVIASKDDGAKWCAATWLPSEQDVFIGGPAGVKRAAQGEAPLENEYCTVVPSRVYDWDSDGVLHVSFHIYFSQDFAGPKTFRWSVSDRSGNRVHTEPESLDDPGEWLHPVLPGGVSPASGSGESQRFEWTFLHPEGGEQARRGRLRFSTYLDPDDRWSGDADCQVHVWEDYVSLSRYIDDDDPETDDWNGSDSVPIGSDAVLENDLCSIDVSGMTDKVAGDARSLSALIGFKPAFAGPFTVEVDGVVRGVWHPGDPGAGPWIVRTVSAASYRSTYLESFGNVVTIFGGGLGPATTVQARADDGQDMPRELAGTRVRVGGTPLPLLSVDSGRIDAVLPYRHVWRGEMIVERNGLSSNPLTVRVDPNGISPGLFAGDGSGAGQALAIHQGDGSRNSPENPAPKGSIIVLYATGLGQTAPSGIDGRIAAEGILPQVRAPVSVLIGNRAAEVLFAGGAPRMVAGISQVKARVGASTPSGSRIPIRLIADRKETNQFLTIAVE